MVATQEKPKQKRKPAQRVSRLKGADLAEAVSESTGQSPVRQSQSRHIPATCTPDVVNSSYQKLRIGVPLTAIIAAIGVSPETFYKWCRDESNGLRKALISARAEFAARNVERIDAAGDRDWRAAAWLLERRDPEHFGRQSTTNTNVQVTFRASESPQTDFGTIDTEAPDAFIDVSSSESEA